MDCLVEFAPLLGISYNIFRGLTAKFFGGVAARRNAENFKGKEKGKSKRRARNGEIQEQLGPAGNFDNTRGREDASGGDILGYAHGRP